MAANVFGNPVTKLTLKAMVEYDGKTITEFDTGKVAYHLKNAENKAVNARTYVDNLKLNYGTGICTKCLLYNATGDSITFVGTHDFYGSIGESPYPMQIENGQWAAFLHVKSPAAASGSSGAIMYRIKGVKKLPDKDEFPDVHMPDVDCMTAWCTSWGPWYNNHCYAEIRFKGYFDDTVWDTVQTKMTNSGLQYYSETVDFFRAEVSMGNSTTPEWEAVLKIGNPNQPS